MALRGAAKEEVPSSVSVTWLVAAGTEPLSYEAPLVTPATAMAGAVFGGSAAFTMNLACESVTVPPVVFEGCVRLMVADPGATGVTVSFFTSPHAPKVIDYGLTVATAVLLEATETVSVVLPVRLQP